MDFPIFENVHQAIGLGFVERHLEMPSIVADDIVLGIDLSEVPCLPGVVGLPEFLEQKDVVALLDANDVIGVCFGQVAQVGSIAAEGVFDDNDLQKGMVRAKVFQPAAGGVAFAVVLLATVLLDDWLGRQRDDLFEIGMDMEAPRS